MAAGLQTPRGVAAWHAAAVAWLVAVMPVATATVAADPAARPDLRAAARARLAEAGDNRAELERALASAPDDDQRRGLEFLITHMPRRDLESLSAAYLLENSRLAWQARRELPWGDAIPEPLFFNDVLPYANLDEPRDDWRRTFFAACLPIVKDHRTPAAAAQRLNRELFTKFSLAYSTTRRAANQGPLESIAAGKASCTGLSIVLVDACRSMGIPARVVGTPLWSNKRGNHTWVEIWDQDWQFTGACEADDRGLNRAWFVGEAARALADSPEHAIYAASFAPTGQHFPLVWAAADTSVPAVNVTTRYALPAHAPPAAGRRPDAAASADAVVDLERFVTVADPGATDIATATFATVPLTRADAESARAALWTYRAARLRSERKAEHDARRLQDGDLRMPFVFSVHGDKPAGGRSLWISLHGGGEAPPQVNDQQWENQQRLYRVPEGVYLAPRAPTNTWNLWHEAHIDGLFQRLIENCVLFEDVDPDRVFLLGYSAGGDGVYQLAPRMADYWAAAAMMAGHPNGVSPLSLRNVPFALQVGADDAAYDRNRVGRAYGETLATLHAVDPGGYLSFVRIHAGKGHWMDRADAAAVPWMAERRRTPVADRVVWKQTGRTHERSYWLAVPAGQARPDSLVVVRRDGQRIVVEAAANVPRLIVRLDDRMLDLDMPIRIEMGDRTLFEGTPPRTIKTLWECLATRADRPLCFSASVTVDLAAPDR
ncbi:MAG: hypothetical protein FJ284_01670 [Planctomycetes bacterium]|nr:hypothetical protein [Planctomycetota bacterium]